MKLFFHLKKKNINKSKTNNKQTINMEVKLGEKKNMVSDLSLVQI